MNETATTGWQPWLHCLRTMSILSALSVPILAGSAAAAPVEMTVDRLLETCRVSTLKDAAAGGDELGWSRMSDADTSEWRAAFVGYNGGKVDVVGWKRDRSDGADSLSFWIAVGPNGHQACAYSTKHPAGLVDALKSRLGSPDSFDQVKEIESTTAFWKKEGWEYAYSQISSSAEIQISRDR